MENAVRQFVSLLAGLCILAGGATAAQQPATSTATAADAESVQALADLIDQGLAAAWKEQGLKEAEPADDATWLRRLSIDLCGTIPERSEVAAFLAERGADKRARKIDEYLADRAFAENLSYLWSNALLSGVTMGGKKTRLRPWLEESFAQETPFADITRELISSVGREDKNGATSFVIAYADEIETLSSVTARTFLGLQLQCAECHDHPSDKWKQTDFNGFAGFFVGVRAKRVGEMPPTYQLYDATSDRMRRDQMKKLEALRRRRRAGADAEPGEMEPGDETLDEMRETMRDGQDLLALADSDPERFQEMLSRLPGEQRERLERQRERQQKFGTAKFLDQNAYQETDLVTRREALAEWIVDPANPWFAKAVVNRMWGHLFGKGLLEPIDDLSGSQDSVLPPMLAVVAQKFEESGTSLRYLVGALVRTRAYGLGLSLTRDEDQRALEERWFAAHPLRPFTAEQVLHSLMRATASDDREVARTRGDDFEIARARLLERFKYFFSDDEGGDGDSFAGSIPQALFLMNGRMTNDEIRLKRNRMLDEILDESRTDRERLRQIFYATLGRPPTQKEAEKLGRLMRGSTGGSKNGIEDLYWSLLNSTEFLTNH